MDYRAAALKLLPHVCARCARELPDGSNWESLCLYCHENEHAREVDSRSGGTSKQGDPEPAKHRPLSGLDALLKSKKK